MKPTVHRPYDRAEDLEEGKKKGKSKETDTKRMKLTFNSPSLSVRLNQRPKKGKLKKIGGLN